MAVTALRGITHGTFSLDGETFEVDNNVWVVGGDTECVVIDAPHDISPILELIDDRHVQAIICTHGHDDHIDAARELAAATGAPVYLHPDDRMLWDAVHAVPPDADLADGQVFMVDEVELTVLHTPGHSPGSCCLYAEQLDSLFSGDTLFAGGPGATGRSYSDFDTIIESITTRLLTLPSQTTVHTGHGEATTIAAEAPHRQEWIDRGH